MVIRTSPYATILKKSDVFARKYRLCSNVFVHKHSLEVHYLYLYVFFSLFAIIVWWWMKFIMRIIRCQYGSCCDFSDDVDTAGKTSAADNVQLEQSQKLSIRDGRTSDKPTSASVPPRSGSVNVSRLWHPATAALFNNLLISPHWTIGCNRGATTAEKSRGTDVLVPTPGSRSTTPGKFFKNQMLNPAFWWLYLLWNFLLFVNYGQEVVGRNQYIVGPPP